MRCLLGLAAVILGLSTLILGCTREGVKMSAEESSRLGDQAKLYTAYNLWYEKPDRMFVINYRRGIMIPAGTEVTAVRVKQSSRKPTIKFKTASNRNEYTINFTPKFFPGVTIDEVNERLFSDKPLEERTAGLKPLEIEAIRKGQLVEGMCKEAVLIARGYPPSHETPSLDADVWYYWEGRFVKEVVRFDADGRTILD